MISKLFFVLILLSLGLKGLDDDVVRLPPYLCVDRKDISSARDAWERVRLRSLCRLIVADKMAEAEKLLGEMYRSDEKLSAMVSLLRNYPFTQLENLERLAVFSGIGIVGTGLITAFCGSMALWGKDSASFESSLEWAAAACGSGIITIATSILFYVFLSKLVKGDRLKKLAQNILDFLDQLETSILS